MRALSRPLRASFSRTVLRAASSRVALIRGDGIGPDISDATVRVIQASGADVAFDNVEVGEAVYTRGIPSGIPPEAWEPILKNRVLLKAPITTPQGKGYKSVNVTLRKTLGLFANVRPVKAFAPFVMSRHPDMDVVIVRENEEDLYAGIEHQQTPQVAQCLKLITEPGSRKIIRYAFEYARRHQRRKVTCFSKDNIMKMTDGLFHRIFDEVSAEYPEIESSHMIIDIGTAKLADSPEDFDVIVTTNLYGDIISDVAAQIAGSVGFASSANIGANTAMFEAVHGSAPDIADKGIANPSGLLLAGVQMLEHMGQSEAASRVGNAWLCAVEDGIRTADMRPSPGHPSLEPVGTAAFADAVIARLGSLPEKLRPYAGTGASDSSDGPSLMDVVNSGLKEVTAKKDLVGVDVFCQWNGSVDELAARVKTASAGGLELKMITNRGVKVWPNKFDETFCTDHWRCRFESAEPTSHEALVQVLQHVVGNGVDFIKCENLFLLDGKPGYALGQGQ